MKMCFLIAAVWLHGEPAPIHWAFEVPNCSSGILDVEIARQMGVAVESIEDVIVERVAG